MNSFRPYLEQDSTKEDRPVALILKSQSGLLRKTMTVLTLTDGQYRVCTAPFLSAPKVKSTQFSCVKHF